ncbi:MAG: SufE family protein, partial [Planctomycetota bacterium]
MSTPVVPPIDEIQDTFELLGDWEERFGYLIDLGKRLPEMPAEDRVEANRVHGCQASVWLKADLAEDQRLALKAASDAHIVNGLIAIMLSLFDGTTPAEARAIDAKAVVEKLGLSEHLSPTRRNGLWAMIERINTLT